jgi:fucose permease
MMLQLGFGLTPFHSGLLTFASAAGAMTNRAAATYIIRRFGYRNTLLFNAFLTSALLGVNAIWRPDTPVIIIFVVLLFGGFFRSLQFSAVNTLGYSDVPANLMSRATPFASMAQQLAASIGIGTGALLVHMTLLIRGHDTLGPSDFTPAFIGVALISILALPIFMRLAPDAGHGMIAGERRAAEADRPGSTGGA